MGSRITLKHLPMPESFDLGLAPLALSNVIAALAAVAAAGGLFARDVYRDNTWVTSAWRGNDLVTLLIAVPVLVASSIQARLGSMRAQLIWLGMLAYMLYGYAFYLFGAAFNRFFLIYVALFACSILALVFALPRLDRERVGSCYRARTPVRWLQILRISGSLPGMLGHEASWHASSIAIVASRQTEHMPTLKQAK